MILPTSIDVTFFSFSSYPLYLTMARRKDRSEDLTQLVRDSSESDLDPGSTNAPVIQISHPNVPEGRPPEDDGGVSNPVFSLGDEEVGPGLL